MQVSIAYILNSQLAFVVLPRSSPLYTELEAPSHLRDRYSKEKEALVGAVLVLSRPTLPRPDPKLEFSIDVSRSFHLSSLVNFPSFLRSLTSVPSFFLAVDQWGIRAGFVNQLRGPNSVAIFAPRSQNGTSLPGVVTLEAILTQPPSSRLPSRGTKVISLTPGTLGLVSTDVVLKHTAMSNWTLPSVVEIRKQRTKFFSFGVGKETFGASHTHLDSYFVYIC